MMPVAPFTVAPAGALDAWAALACTPLVQTLRAMALRGLASMYRADAGLFVFTVRRQDDNVVAEGLSQRYTAIALIGLAGEDRDVVTDILGGRSVAEACDGLVTRITVGTPALGDAALTCWAARAVDCALRHQALAHLLALEPGVRRCPTVELSWALSALSAESSDPARFARDRIAARLMAAFQPEANGFPHTIGGGRELRTHVSCFADQVYPVLALSQYAEQTGDVRAVDIAQRTAAHLCELQGRSGQWWWHYHAGVGSLVERYPVYAVHQHAMAPMALAALERVSGSVFAAPAASGLEWLRAAPELDGGSLIDPGRDMVWRKVGRREPAKASRYLQALATRLHPRAAWPMLDRLFPPGAIDFECRPYELGWLLWAWPARAAAGCPQS